MAKLITASVEPALDAVIHITPISTSANHYAPVSRQVEIVPSAPPLTPPPARPVQNPAPLALKTLDKRLGPLRIGEFTISRVELQAMGATVNGEHISGANAHLEAADKTFLDALGFDPAQVESRIKSTDNPDSSKVATLFFEIACKRSPTSAPLFIASTPLAPGNPMARFDKLLGSAQKIDIHRVDSLEHMPGWVNRSKSYLQSGAGVGLQAYGIYSGLIGIAEAIKVGDLGEAAFNAGGISSEIGSLIIERGLSKGGEAMFQSGATVFNRFPATSIGKTLSRGAGLFASAITLPFDIIGAVKAFNAAAGTTGKAAQDHYVSGGLSVAGAGISIALGLAALAGFGSVAGPLGLAAAAVLVLGAEIYRAARVVDDIDDYIELGFHERLRSGWFAFTHQELDQDVMDRFRIAKATGDHRQQQQASATALLQGAYKNYIEHVVNGSFNVQLRPINVWRHQWDASAGEQPFKIENEPVVVSSDDHIDARDGLPPDLERVVSGEAGDGKGVLWRLDDGYDRVVGVKNKPNYFTYRTDAKNLTGGDKDDTFLFEVAETEFDRAVRPARTSILDGSAGTDLLAFEGARPRRETRFVGHDVHLPSGEVALRSGDPQIADISVAQIKDIENISTLRQGSSTVTGDDRANVIVANGYDTVTAGAGDDKLVIRGAQVNVDGGAGTDRYYIAETSIEATIVENGQQISHIELGWPAENIQQWRIVGTSLVITSRRGADGELPEHTLTIENVYRTLNGQRQVINNLLLFITSDGYELLPVLPALLQDLLPHTTEVIVTVNGSRPPAPCIINGGVLQPKTAQPQHYFMSRNNRRVDFSVPHGTARTSSVIHLDYNSTELLGLGITYSVDSNKGVSGFSYLTYRAFTIRLQLLAKAVFLSNVVGERSDNKTDVGGGRMAAGIETRHDVVLVFKDGESYRLVPPALSYIADSAAPGYQSRPAPECLKPRHGRYLFNRPQVTERHLLPVHPGKVDINSTQHKGKYALQGQSSIYDVYPSSNAIISLSTPGAQARTANASTWTFYSTRMTETVTRSDIRLSGNELHVASVLIELPDIDEETPVESISVATSSGNIYEVSLLFEVLQLYVIEARGYATLAALLEDIRQHRERHELASQVFVLNIGSTVEKSGHIYYNASKDYWGIDSDLSYRIKPQDLVINRALIA